MSIYFLIYLACILSCVLSISDVEIVDRIRCVEYCHKASNRRCFASPLSCGDCLPNFQLTDGKCIFTQGLNLQVKEQGVTGSGGGEAGGGVSSTTSSGLNLAWIILIAVLCGVVAFLLVALIVVSVYFCVKSQNAEKESLNHFFASDPPLYNGGSVPMAEDRKLAYSAQMYHFQHQKQQMLNMELANEKNSEEGSGVGTDDEELHDNVVYECHGLAHNSVEMVVDNPYFSEQPAPVISNGPISP